MRTLGAMVLLLVLHATAQAHTRSTSYSTWTLSPSGDAVSVHVRLALRERHALAAAGLEPAQVLPRSLRLVGCTPRPDSFLALRAAGHEARFMWQGDCVAVEAIEVSTLFGLAAGHVHLTSVLDDRGEVIVDAVLTETRTRVGVGDGSPPEGSSWLHWTGLGALHILGGWDHLVFLLLLALAATGFNGLLLMATGFTLGHTLTLVSASLGLANPDVMAVEALIALSIVLVAAETLWRTLRRPGSGLAIATVAATVLVAPFATNVPTGAMLGVALSFGCYLALSTPGSQTPRLAAATLFGLLHGFGFAGVLADLGGAQARLVPLVSFNLGVELGQVAILALAWPALRWLRRFGQLPTGIGSSVAAGIGTFWFVSRAFA